MNNAWHPEHYASQHHTLKQKHTGYIDIDIDIIFFVVCFFLSNYQPLPCSTGKQLHLAMIQTWLKKKSGWDFKHKLKQNITICLCFYCEYSTENSTTTKCVAHIMKDINTQQYGRICRLSKNSANKTAGRVCVLCVSHCECVEYYEAENAIM